MTGRIDCSVGPKLCLDHDGECISIFAEGYAHHCWMHDPTRGYCPYLKAADCEHQGRVAIETRN